MKFLFLKGYNKVEAEIPRKEMIEFWVKAETHWGKLADYLAKKNKMP